MTGAQSFGYVLIAVSGVLLALHWQHWRDAVSRALGPADREFTRRLLQRRSVASALIGVVGAAITLVDRVPHNPLSMTAYLFGLLLAGAVILAIALADLRGLRRRRDVEHLELIAHEMRKAGVMKRGAARPNHAESLTAERGPSSDA